MADSLTKGAAPLRKQLVSAIEDKVAGPERAALVVAQIINPDSAVEYAVAELDRLASLVPRRDTKSLLKALAEEGFSGDSKSFYTYENSEIPSVLKRQTGIPISLGMIAVAVASRIELPASGISFPDHFLVKIADDFVDPFSMSVIEYEDFRKQALARNENPPEEPRAATTFEIVVRMLTNLTAVAQKLNDPVRALEFNDYMKLLNPKSYEVCLIRADIWLNLLDVASARSQMEEAIQLAPRGRIRKHLREELAKFVSDPVNLN